MVSATILAQLVAIVATAEAKKFFPRAGYKPYDQQFLDQFNPLNFMGTFGPYRDAAGFGISRNPPDNCELEQVVMIMRHGERFPDSDTAAASQSTVNKIFGSGIGTFQGSLSFLNNNGWELTPTDSHLFDTETFSGPYSGIAEAFRFGSIYRDRYGELWDGQSVIPFFPSSSSRVVNTAKLFGMGFLSTNYSSHAAINTISESALNGANSVTPVCLTELSGPCNSLTGMMPQFDDAAQRLNNENPGLKLEAADVLNLLTMASYESNYHSVSPWVNVFTQEEWAALEFAIDQHYYYCNGAGTNTTMATGQVFLNATLRALDMDAPPQGNLTFMFAHETDVIPIVAALNLTNPFNDLPTDGTVSFHDQFHVTEIAPMLGHLTLEKMKCNKTKSFPERDYVRVILNEATIPIPGCQDGPGYMCSLDGYRALIRQLPAYRDTCIPKGIEVNKTLSFLFNPSFDTSTNAL